MTIKALHVTTDHEFHVVEIDGQLADFQRLVGGDIEAIYGPGWAAYIHVEGKFDRKAQNVAAEVLARETGWGGDPRDYIAGDVVFVGPADEHGDDTSAPQHLIDLTRHARTRALALIAYHQEKEGHRG